MGDSVYMGLVGVHETIIAMTSPITHIQGEETIVAAALMASVSLWECSRSMISQRVPQQLLDKMARLLPLGARLRLHGADERL
jgi:hypothetical protein